MRELELPNPYIPRTEEIKQINYGLTETGCVIITGAPGIGKSVLIHAYIKENRLKFFQTQVYSGLQIEFYENQFNIMQFPNTAKEKILVVIDGYDEISSPELKKKVLRIATEGKKYNTKLIITSQEISNDSPLWKNSYIIHLKGFNHEQFLDYLNKTIHQKNLKNNYTDLLSLTLNTLTFNPLIVTQFYDLITKLNINEAEILSLINDRIHYKNEIDIITPPYTYGQIIKSEPPKIISDVQLINSSLIDRVKQHPDMLYQITSRQFEELVAELFEKEGYKVKITQSTRDGGKDLIILEHKRIGNFLIYAECKNYSMDNPVGVRIVRELYGTIMADRATMGVLVTSSYFSAPAIRFQEQLKTQLSLIDYYELKKWIDDNSK